MNSTYQRPSQQHRHFGYWINRRSGQARCYECQYQFAGDDTTAEAWVAERGRAVRRGPNPTGS